MRIATLLFLGLPIILLANPAWLYHIKSDNQNEIIGYGIDKKLSQAKQNAISDISKSISVTINSSMQIDTRGTTTNFNQKISSKIKTDSNAILSGVKFIKAEQFNNLWYVAAKYDNSPLEIKIKKLLPKNLTNEVQNSYLKNTELFQTINQELSTKLNFSIIRKDNLWQIKYKNVILPLTQAEFYKLFSNQSTKSLELKANQSIYKQNDEMYFKIKNIKSGFITILYVEHNGKVGLLLSNQKVDGDFTYPDLLSEDTFKIANPYNKPIQELYIAVYSKQKLDLSQFETVSENLLDDSNYTFDKLVKILDKYSFSTYTIKIRK